MVPLRSTLDSAPTAATRFPKARPIPSILLKGRDTHILYYEISIIFPTANLQHGGVTDSTSFETIDTTPANGTSAASSSAEEILQT